MFRWYPIRSAIRQSLITRGTPILLAGILPVKLLPISLDEQREIGYSSIVAGTLQVPFFRIRSVQTALQFAGLFSKSKPNGNRNAEGYAGLPDARRSGLRRFWANPSANQNKDSRPLLMFGAVGQLIQVLRWRKTGERYRGDARANRLAPLLRNPLGAVNDAPDRA